MRLRNSSSTASRPYPVPEAGSSSAPTPERRRSLSRGLYLLLLIGGLLLGLRFLILGATFAEAPGVVDSGEMALGVERSGRTESVRVRLGQTVRKGETLAEVSVLSEQAAAEQARRELEQLRSEAAAERARAAARARERVASHLAEAARLRDDALRSHAEAEQLSREIASLRRQVAELDEELSARAELQRQELLSRSALVDLKVRRHDLQGRREGLARRKSVLEENVAQLQNAAAQLDDRSLVAAEEAIAESQLGALEARAVQLEAKAAQHEQLSRQELLAPADGTVSWLEARRGEIVQPQSPLVRLVPHGRPVVLAWPGRATPAFPPGARVRVRGTGFETSGTVERTLLEDRAKPATLLRPYEREAVEPAILIRLDSPEEGTVRAGSIVEISRPRLRWLERWLLEPEPESTQSARR